MENYTYLIILLAIGLIFVTYKWIKASSAERNAPAVKSTIEDIMTRTSVRAYSDRKITSGQIDTLLRAAMAAPSAGNKQPWRFIVVDKKELLDSISTNFNTMTMAKNAQLAVIMCGEPAATFSGEGEGYWIQDVSAASENLLLAAHAMGLGAVWCGIYPISDRVRKFSELFSIPDNITPMACICVGYPKAEQKPKDKWNPGHVRYNQWDAQK